MLLAASEFGRHEEAQVALDDAALVFGQAIGVLPQRDVAGHVHLLRHPVVGAGGQSISSQAHLYLKGTSWFTSVLALMMRLSAAFTRLWVLVDAPASALVAEEEGVVVKAQHGHPLCVLAFGARSIQPSVIDYSAICQTYERECLHLQYF